MARSLVIYGAVGLLAAAGVLEGFRTNRWGQTDDAKAAVARLDAVPRAFGEWTSTENPIEEKILKVAEATGSVSRVYKNSLTGNTVSVLILCGPPGPIGAHTPDICYRGLGYEMAGSELRRTLRLPDGQTASYWSTSFVKRTAGDAPLNVCWAWGVDGEWAASAAPRRDFVLRSALYKVYVSRQPTPAERDAKPAADPVEEFLTDFLPVVKKALSPTPG
jgi:hypothetical protein